MNEIYWLTRFDAINDVVLICVFVLGIILAACLISAGISYVEGEDGIGNCCAGRSKSSGGFIWKYKEQSLNN